jgi:antagonist of KipI
MSDTLRIVRPGLLTTVQDLGRWGHQAEAVSVSGPMDWFSHRLANELVGNPSTAATLEATLIGPELIVDADTIGAVAGADFEVTCDDATVASTKAFAIRRGARVRFGRRHAGSRAYLAIAGGITTPRVLGSRATDLVSGIGGVDGRALIAGDVLPLGMATLVSTPPRDVAGLALPITGQAQVRIMPGGQAEWFTAEAWTMLTTASFRVSSRSNRMGFRLEGPALTRLHSDELITEPLAEGAIQVPAAGEPILLMADRQTAGGYPKIANLIKADLPLAGQLAPGDTIRFQSCTHAEAVGALIARERQLLRYAGLRDAS